MGALLRVIAAPVIRSLLLRSGVLSSLQAAASWALLLGSLAAQSYLIPRTPHVEGGVPPPGVSPCIYADFNGDGYGDLVLWIATTLDCHLGTPTGSFVSTGPVQTPAGLPNTWSLREMLLGPADLDDDGDLDIIRGGLFGPRPVINQGAGAFNVGGGPTWPISAFDMAIDDMDGVSPVELIYPELFASGVGTAVSLATYDAVSDNLVPQLTIPTGPCTGVRTGDFNGDGARDILVLGVGPGGGMEFFVLAGNGLGTGYNQAGPFPMLSTTTGAGPVGVSPMIGDLTGDGIDDVFTETDIPGTFSLHAGVAAATGNNILAAPVTITVPWTPCMLPTGPVRARIADIDADGLLDLIWSTCVTPGSSWGVSDWVLRVWRGLGGGTFGAPTDMPLLASVFYDYGPAFFDLEDVDGDGDQDLAYGSVSWFLWDLWLQQNENRAILGPGTGPVGGVAPTQSFSPLQPGAVFTVGLDGAAPNVTAALGISTNSYLPAASAGPIWLDTQPGALIWPAAGAGTFTTTANGTAALSVTIPVSTPPGATLFTQWIAQSPAGGYTLFGSTWALSEGRTLILF